MDRYDFEKILIGIVVFGLIVGGYEVISLAWYKLVYGMSPKEVLIYKKAKYNTHDVRWHSNYDDNEYE